MDCTSRWASSRVLAGHGEWEILLWHSLGSTTCHRKSVCLRPFTAKVGRYLILPQFVGHGRGLKCPCAIPLPFFQETEVLF